MRRLAVLLLLPALLLAVPKVQAGGGPAGSGAFNLEQYRRELDRWQAATASLPSRPGQAAALRRQLPESWDVALEGQEFRIPLDWLRGKLASLENHTPDARMAAKDIRDRLRAMRAEADALNEPPWFESAAARQKLDEILTRREFRSVRGPTGLDRLAERIEAWAEDLYDRLTQPLEGHPLAGKMLLGALALVPVLALAVWLVRWVLYRPSLPALDLRGSAVKETSWQGYLGQAAARAVDGDYRGAVRLAYWAGIFRLGELGVWQVDRTRTHREYLRLLGGDDPNRGALSDLTRRFERVWYAGRTAAREDFQSALSQLEKLGCELPPTPATVK